MKEMVRSKRSDLFQHAILIILLDSFILVFCFYFLLYIKYDTFYNIPRSGPTIKYFLFVWIVLSLLSKKYSPKSLRSYKDILAVTAISNLLILGFTFILVRIIRHFTEFMFILFYAIFLTTLVEVVLGYLYSIVKSAREAPFFLEETNEWMTPVAISEPGIIGKEEPVEGVRKEEFIEPRIIIDLNNIIVEETDAETLSYINPYFSSRVAETLILSTTTVFNIYNQPRSKYEVIINLKRINDFQYINKFFEAVNSKLHPGGLFLDWAETYSQRKKRILEKYTWGFNYFVYTLDFFLKRVGPKLKMTKKLYFLITRGQNRAISKAETFGRLYSCGFEFVENQVINNRFFFVFRKIGEPVFDYHPTYGPLIRLKRIGKNGKIISVFKFRTMHAYSEYLQAYMYKYHNLREGGKFRDDFRVTTIGKLFRTLWIDELPMLFNVFFLRNMKIVGVRPLSQHYFSLYSEELQQKRILNKPGLIPPYYAQFPTPKTLKEIQANEMKYLMEYEKSPFLTDMKYFFKAFYNIIFRKARSK